MLYFTNVEFEELVKLLIETFIMPSSMLKGDDQSYEVIDKILMLCTLDGLHGR